MSSTRSKQKFFHYLDCQLGVIRVRSTRRPSAKTEPRCGWCGYMVVAGRKINMWQYAPMRWSTLEQLEYIGSKPA